MQSYRLAILMLAEFALGGSAARAGDLSVLYTFMGTADGGMPHAALISAGGTLYGTTLKGRRLRLCVHASTIGR